MKNGLIISVLFSSSLLTPAIGLAQSASPVEPDTVSNFENQLVSEEEELQDYGLKAKALKYALKAGGWALSKIIDGLVSEAQGRVIREFSDEIADVLDVPGDILEDVVYGVLREGGVEESMAHSVAGIIAFIAL